MTGRPGKALATLGAVAALGLMMPQQAHAATGQFTYHTQPGNTARTLTDPRDGDCYPVGRNARGRVVNNTDRRAVLYVEKNCRQATAEELDPGQWVDNAVFMSVQFTA
ncbi:hypothetical protein ABT354_13855 [Streptomyces sp. NPDC000594]|uniref:hypothetical protein n=1 Tax=Streptomyces sp. NPDC000594 TaxID=3154261 RepID=UPI003327BA11